MPNISRRYVTFVTAAAACALLFAAPSIAQTAPSAATPTQQAMRHPETVEQHIKSLHDRLKITQEQEGLWSELAQVMRANAQSMDKLIQQRQQNYKTMKAPDDLKSYEAITEAHADGLKKLSPAFENLYAAMSDAQKKNADAVFHAIAQRHTASAAAPKTAAPAK